MSDAKLAETHEFGVPDDGYGAPAVEHVIPVALVATPTCPKCGRHLRLDFGPVHQNAVIRTVHGCGMCYPDHEYRIEFPVVLATRVW